MSAAKSVKTGKRAATRSDERDAAPGAANDTKRYRVTGSLFLLALAVILLPMLLDGDGLPPVEIEPIDAPRETPAVVPLEQVAPASDVADRVAELRAEVDEDGFMTDTGIRFGEPVLSEAAPDTRVWAVQVASFADEERALKLRDELRGDGYEAFLSSHRTGAAVLTRVAVGPLLSRAGADSMRIQLSEELALETRVVGFSN